MNAKGWYIYTYIRARKNFSTIQAYERPFINRARQWRARCGNFLNLFSPIFVRPNNKDEAGERERERGSSSFLLTGVACLSPCSPLFASPFSKPPRVIYANE